MRDHSFNHQLRRTTSTPTCEHAVGCWVLRGVGSTLFRSSQRPVLTSPHSSIMLMIFATISLHLLFLVFESLSFSMSPLLYLLIICIGISIQPGFAMDCCSNNCCTACCGFSSWLECFFGPPTPPGDDSTTTANPPAHISHSRVSRS